MCQVSPVAVYVYVCCIGGNQIRWCGGVTGVSTLDGTHGPLIRSVQAPTPAPTSNIRLGGKCVIFILFGAV